MTMRTSCFLYDKEKGNVHKTGRAGFFDGNRYYERVLWYNSNDRNYYVILNGEAYTFRLYTKQPYDGLVIGFI